MRTLPAQLLAALRAADQRVVRAAQPRLAPLQRAMQRDADRLRASASSDAKWVWGEPCRALRVW